MPVMFKAVTSRLFDSPSCVRGATADSPLTGKRTQLVSLNAFSQRIA